VSLPELATGNQARRFFLPSMAIWRRGGADIGPRSEQLS
jgi:hypothetical protein